MAEDDENELLRRLRLVPLMCLAADFRLRLIILRLTRRFLISINKKKQTKKTIKWRNLPPASKLPASKRERKLMNIKLILHDLRVSLNKNIIAKAADAVV